MFNSLVQSEGPLSARGLAASSGIKGQQICIITKIVSYHLDTKHNCRKRVVEYSWKTSLKHRYVTPHSESRGLKAKLKQKQSRTSPCTTLTHGYTGVALLEAKINFLFDKLLALPCFCSQGHHQSSAINPSQNDILSLNQAFSVSLLLQLSVLAHFYQNNDRSDL